jgi:galactose mutarotase-like enzyme
VSCFFTEIEIQGLRAIFLENDLIKVGILVDRGSDIFEFTYKPKGVDFLLRLPKGIQNPQRHFSQIRNTKSQFEDHYYGGWQICLPNSPAFNYRGAELGQHGEVSHIPWSIVVKGETKNGLELKLKVSPVRIPITIERIFTLEENSTSLRIEERVSNESKTHLDIMWGQHIAFGLPFLKEGVKIDTNAKFMTTEPAMPANHKFKRDEKYHWPKALDTKGKQVHANQISAHGEEQYADLCYLDKLDEQAFYTIKNEKLNLGFGLQWDGRLFKDLWFWQERNATQDFPWWGDCYTVALEPWTSKWTQDPEKAIKNGEWLRLEARQTIETTLVATAFENEFKRFAL